MVGREAETQDCLVMETYRLDNDQSTVSVEDKAFESNNPTTPGYP